jgi:IS605 OrfB family transposase
LLKYFLVKGGDNMFTVTAKIQILPSSEQQRLLSYTMQAYKNACNFVSDYIFETHNLVQASVNRTLYYDTRSNVCHVVGIDLGINFLATAYDSYGKTKFFDGRQIKNRRTKYKELRRNLQKRQTPSARRRLKSIGQRENRWMSDVNHCISKALVESHPVGTLFAIEDLTGIRAATEKVRRKDKYEFVSWSFYDFRQKLAYKAWFYGSKVKAFEPAYTSQTCPVCGHREKSNRDKIS